jgi:hypothetical protein
MNTSTQSAGEPSMLDPVYGYRDDLAEHFKPVSAYERLLLGVAAQALKRFNDAQSLERRLFEKVDPLELLTNSPDTFKTVTRHVADCERAWRKSLEEIRRAIRQRETGPTPRKSYPRPTVPPPQSAARPNIPVPPAPVQSRRE